MELSVWDIYLFFSLTHSPSLRQNHTLSLSTHTHTLARTHVRTHTHAHTHTHSLSVSLSLSSLPLYHIVLQSHLFISEVLAWVKWETVSNYKINSNSNIHHSISLLTEPLVSLRDADPQLSKTDVPWHEKIRVTYSKIFSGLLHW